MSDAIDEDSSSPQARLLALADYYDWAARRPTVTPGVRRERRAAAVNLRTLERLSHPKDIDMSDDQQRTVRDLAGTDLGKHITITTTDGSLSGPLVQITHAVERTELSSWGSEPSHVLTHPTAEVTVGAWSGQVHPVSKVTFQS